MTQAKKKELSVETVAAQLGVSERSIVNYLRTRRIEGIKIGKKWFIDAASVDAFILRYGFTTQSPQKSTEPTHSREYSTLPQLHLFQVCREAFASCDWEHGLSPHAQERIRNLKSRVLEEIGAGFHSFGMQRKTHHYNTARAQIGAILAILHSQGSSRESSPTILILEKKLLPAFSALLRLHKGSATFFHHNLIRSHPVKTLHRAVVDLELHPL